MRTIIEKFCMLSFKIYLKLDLIDGAFMSLFVKLLKLIKKKKIRMYLYVCVSTAKLKTNWI